MTRPLHILLGVGAAALAGAAWAAIAGFLKAAVGAHEVITTIMLNWIAFWIGVWLFQQGGPLQGAANKPLDIPISGDIANSAKLPVFWGDPELQGLHIGFFVAIAALIVFWAILTGRRSATRCERSATTLTLPRTAESRCARTTCGRWPSPGPSRVSRAASTCSAISSTSDVGRPGLEHRVPRDRGRLLGRNTAVGVGLAALLFGALLFGTTHGLQSNVIDPSLAGPPDRADPGARRPLRRRGLLIIAVWRAGGRLRKRPPKQAPAGAAS
jgi:simple sugar transport system permease protein